MDHLTSGDVMTVLYAIVGISLSTWATLVGMAMLFSRRASCAEDLFEQSPWRCFLLGLVVYGVFGLLAAVLLGLPNPAAKLVGWGLLSYLLALSAIGGGGLALMISRRIGRMDDRLSMF